MMTSALPYSFGSWHPSVCQFVLADGSVAPVSVTINHQIYGYLGNRSDGVPVSDY